VKRYYTLCYCSFFICITSYAGIMRHDIEVQDYRDFAENLGKYSINATNIPVYKKDGTLSGYLQFSMPDFAMVVSGGYASLVSVITEAIPALTSAMVHSMPLPIS